MLRDNDDGTASGKKENSSDNGVTLKGVDLITYGTNQQGNGITTVIMENVGHICDAKDGKDNVIPSSAEENFNHNHNIFQDDTIMDIDTDINEEGIDNTTPNGHATHAKARNNEAKVPKMNNKNEETAMTDDDDDAILNETDNDD